MIPGIDTGGGGFSAAETDNGHMSTGSNSFGGYTVNHAPVNIGGSSINDNKWLYVAGVIAVAFFYFDSKKGRK